MANGRNPKRKGHDTSRDQGGFVAFPWAVLDCPAYGLLSMHARALLLEVARQIDPKGDNNGKLLLSRAHMGTRGWKSADMLTKAKRELLGGGFIFETVMGHRPNKASWYAVTWRTLVRSDSYDAGASLCFERGAYRNNVPLKNTSLIPPHGTDTPLTVPPDGTGSAPTVPPHGAMKPTLGGRSVPPHGNHLDKPSTAVERRLGMLSFYVAAPTLDLDRNHHVNRYRWLTQDQIGFIASLTSTSQSLTH